MTSRWIPTDEPLAWESTNFWGTNWGFVDEAGYQLVAFIDGVRGARLRDNSENPSNSVYRSSRVGAA